MLSSILKSDRAIQVNIQIMRTFTKIRELMATNESLRHKIETMEKNTINDLLPFSAPFNISSKKKLEEKLNRQVNRSVFDIKGKK